MLLRILEGIGVAGNLLHRSYITICFAILLMSLSVMDGLRDRVCWFCRIQQDSLSLRDANKRPLFFFKQRFEAGVNLVR
jgi:hypothetical protein